ncbi:MAG TPA: 50S ribosomal protein L4 [bacterium]|nr:50S ribosomal protein L4 [bacterium]HOL48913.1 50S ribosomal protein L4 [bacterium]HPQ18528.1 50S ribosomal protein L4 [bacterium]
MAIAGIYNLNGEKLGEYELNDEVFNSEINTNCIYEGIVAYLRNKRLGTASTKTRAEIVGSSKKPWRQKGTGRARAGTRKSPLWIGGGITFGPKPRDYTYKFTKKKKRIALKSGLTNKCKENKIIIIDEINLETPKTKVIQNFLNKMNLNKKILFIISKEDEILKKSIRNIPTTKVINVNNINIYDIVKADTIVIKKDLVSKIEEKLK